MMATMARQASNASRYDDDDGCDYPVSTPAVCANPPSLLIKRPAAPIAKYPKHPFHNSYFKLGQGIAWMHDAFGLVSPWPSTLDCECRKAAKILRKFTGEGDPLTPEVETSDHRRRTRRTYITIRQDDLTNAHGLVIFSMGRVGGFLLGQTVGNGVVVARLPDGSWSPPAAIGVVSLSFINVPIAFGLDLVEVVMVLPTAEAVDSFKDSFRVSLGLDAAVSFGPLGVGIGAELASNKASYNKMPRVYSRSRGLFFGNSLNVRFVGSGKAADELFYGKKGITTNQVLKGNVPIKGPPGMWPEGAQPLMNVLTAEAGPCHWGVPKKAETVSCGAC
ncbi:hypothetical protein B0T14DRAFT_584966 [Immersiella caudata]|uniref:Ysc84 actin-binding domain-containing protein n=1 Tax=Immersiella caudata TaxID=314043 RepID=A0AA40BZ80_9PEZI|nr:hypothetical protein B0T14DRAFT_584966 [Immersiella caudata]